MCPLGAELFVRFKLDDCDQGKSEITLEGYVRLISEAPAHVVRAWLRLMVDFGTCEPVLGDAATREGDFHQWFDSVGYRFVTVHHCDLPLLSMPPDDVCNHHPGQKRPAFNTNEDYSVGVSAILQRQVCQVQELGERLRSEIRSIESQKRRDVRKMAHAKEDARLARVDATLARCEAIRASRAEMVARNLIAREMNRAKECIGLANIEAV